MYSSDSGFDFLIKLIPEVAVFFLLLKYGEGQFRKQRYWKGGPGPDQHPAPTGWAGLQRAGPGRRTTRWSTMFQYPVGNAIGYVPIP